MHFFKALFARSKTLHHSQSSRYCFQSLQVVPRTFFQTLQLYEKAGNNNVKLTIKHTNRIRSKSEQQVQITQYTQQGKNYPAETTISFSFSLQDTLWEHQVLSRSERFITKCLYRRRFYQKLTIAFSATRCRGNCLRVPSMSLVSL